MPSSIKSLPVDLYTPIFEYLPPRDLGRALQVSKGWNTIASKGCLWDAFDLQKICNCIDEKIWQEHFPNLKTFEIDPSGAPPLNNRIIIPILLQLALQTEGGIVTLLTKPRGLTFNKFLALINALEEPYSARIRGLWADIPEEIGENRVEKTEVIIIANSVLKGSRDLPVKRQKELVAQAGWELPNTLELTSLSILTYLNSLQHPYPTLIFPRGGKRNFLDIFGGRATGLQIRSLRRTFALASEKIDRLSVVVGGFDAREGLRIDAYGKTQSKDVGACAVWRLTSTQGTGN